MTDNPSPPPIPLLLTRPRAASETYWHSLPTDLRGRLKPIISPLIEIVALLGTPDLTDTDAVIFSSANGVLHAPDGTGRVAYCVGDATTQAARHRGWDATTAGATSAELIAHLSRKRSKQRLVHLSGIHTRGDIAGHLRRAGLNVTHQTVYDQELCRLSDEAVGEMAGPTPIIVPLFSPRTATQFAKCAPSAKSCHVIAISAPVAAAVATLPVAGMSIATSPDAAAMTDALQIVVERMCAG